MTLVRAGSSIAAGLALCQLTHLDLWVRYFSLGGSRTIDELRAYLHDLVTWPATEHDIAAQALNEACHALGLGFPVQYADELCPPALFPNDPAPGLGALISHSPGTPPARERAEPTQSAPALRDHAQQTGQQLTEIAGSIAQTFADLARVYDQVAATTQDPTTAARVRTHAHRVRRLADRLRREHQRRATDADPDGLSPGRVATS